MIFPVFSGCRGGGERVKTGFLSEKIKTSGGSFDPSLICFIITLHGLQT